MSWSINMNIPCKHDEDKSKCCHWLETLTDYVAKDNVTQARVSFLVDKILEAEENGGSLELSDESAKLLQSIVGEI